MTGFRLLVAAASAALLALWLPVSNAQDKGAKEEKSAKKAGLAGQDRQALQTLQGGNLAEIEAGKLAAQRASNAEVKTFGQRMVDDHTKMFEEGTKVEQAKGVKPPAAPDSKHREAAQKLQGLSGDEFDSRYIRDMVKDHEEALQVAEKAAKEAKDPDVRAYAQAGVPIIKEHLAMARQLNASLAASAGASSKKASGETKK